MKAASPLANARRQAKYFLQFLICARHRKILLKGKKYFAWLCSERADSGCGHCFIFLARRNEKIYFTPLKIFFYFKFSRRAYFFLTTGTNSQLFSSTVFLSGSRA